MATITELTRQLQNISRDISTTNTSISAFRGQIADISAAQTELRSIIDIAANDRRALDMLDCENPHYWKGYEQAQCYTGYNECTQMMANYTDRLDTWADELVIAHARSEQNLENQLTRLTQLNNSHRRITDQLANLR